MTRDEAIKVLRTESIELGGAATSVCRFLEALDMAVKALVDVPDKDVGKNEPLTLDELRKMDGEPVYIVDGDVAWWDIVSHSTKYFLMLVREEAMPFIRYGKTWLTYRQKPEEGTV